ncbi:hypothetical protein [Streptomyces sp. DH12]|uniref:Vgb family protein n=1 Tax=Streptomyces sp. DH12 TaxID=2857010 RepID=UPI001E2BDABB|nr:hypothetical protein [Streptomyces sp. DH12]
MGKRYRRSTTALATALAAGAVLTAGASTVTAAESPAYRCPARACFEVASGFGNPQGLAVDPQGGKAYVADAYDNIVYEVDVASGTKKKVKEKLDAYGVALHGKDTLFVTDQDTDKLHELNLANGRLTTVTSEISDPYGVAVSGDGSKAYVSSPSHNTLYEVDLKTGATVKVATNIDAVGLKLDDAGNAYVTTYDDDKLYRVELKSGRLTTVASGLKDPDGLVLDGAGQAFVASHDGDKIVKVDLKTGATSDVAVNLDGADGLALDEKGRLHLTTNGSGNAKLWAVDHLAAPPVRHTAEVTSEGAGATKPGEFAHPAVKVTNTGARRIGSEPVVVTAGPGTLIAGTKLSWWVNGGQTSHECVRSADKTKLTCDEVPLNIDPRVKAKLWVTTKVNSDVKPGTQLKATFELGSPAFARGDSEYNVPGGTEK